jgi:hypothetical protein
MPADVRLNELLRAVEAAGFAMAAPDDEPTSVAAGAPIVKAVSVEDRARGARDVINAQSTARRSSVLVPASVRTGAHSVRETVYGYLRFGAPA